MGALSTLQATLEGLTVATKEQHISTEENNVVDIAEYREEQQEVQHPAQQKAPRLATPRSTTGATNGKQKALRILQRHPGLSALDLARKAGISRQYASRILAETTSA
jgi:hypothetical protein